MKLVAVVKEEVMEMFDWEEIERQHQELISKLNKLNHAVGARVPREDIYRIIDDIIQYTRQHFETEEKIMAHYGSSELAWHREQHRELVKDALRLKDKLDYIGEEMFTDWFNHWPFSRVLAHIQFADNQAHDQIMQSDTGNT